jgi:hypothetical protein
MFRLDGGGLDDDPRRSHDQQRLAQAKGLLGAARRSAQAERRRAEQAATAARSGQVRGIRPGGPDSRPFGGQQFRGTPPGNAPSWTEKFGGVGRFEPSGFEPGRYESGRFESGKFESGKFVPGKFVSGRFVPGKFVSGGSARSLSYGSYGAEYRTGAAGRARQPGAFGDRYSTRSFSDGTRHGSLPDWDRRAESALRKLLLKSVSGQAAPHERKARQHENSARMRETFAESAERRVMLPPRRTGIGADTDVRLALNGYHQATEQWHAAEQEWRAVASLWSTVA